MKNKNAMPNIRCKFSGCTCGTDPKSIQLNNGEENGPKWIFACLYCKRTENWKTMACCSEHYEEYQKEVIVARSKNKPMSTIQNEEEKDVKIDADIDTAPIMTDMTTKEYSDLMQKPIEEVIEESKQELTNMGYGDEVEQFGITKTVDIVNQDISAETDAGYKNTFGRKQKNKSKHN